jgi:predicted nucleic acid-binding protein
VYLFDTSAPAKQRRAQALFEELALTGQALLSTQVLQEFYVTVTQKLAEPVELDAAYQAVRDLATLPLVQVDPQLVLAGIQRSQRDRLSFWDALIVQAAIEGGAEVLITEDLQHGRKFDGLVVQNPFRSMRAA